MRRRLGILLLAALACGFVPSIAPAAPAAASIRCLQISPTANAPGSCTYTSTAFEHEVLTAFTLKGYTVDWTQDGVHHSFVCTAGSCRNQPGFKFTADAGTPIHVTVTQGVMVVRQFVVAGMPV